MWTSMHWLVFALLLIICALLLLVIHQADRAARAESALRGQPTRAQRRQWRRQRLVLPKAVVNRKRA